MPTNQLHSVMRVKQSGSIVLLQPFRGPDVAGDTLSVDLSRYACTGTACSGASQACRTPVPPRCMQPQSSAVSIEDESLKHA